MAGPTTIFNATASGEGTTQIFRASDANVTSDLTHEFQVDATTDFVTLTRKMWSVKRKGVELFYMLRNGAATFVAGVSVGGTLGVTGASALAALSCTTLAASATATLQGVSCTTLAASGTANLQGVSCTSLTASGIVGGASASFSGGGSFGTTPTVGGTPVSMPSASETLLNKVGISSTGALTGSLNLPVGTTAQRPASPQDGTIRYNSETASFEGRVSGAWAGVGGGVHAAKTAQTPADLAALTLGIEGFQKLPVSGAAGVPVQLSATPFGGSAPAIEIEVVLVGLSTTAPVTLETADVAKGFVGNGRCVLTKGSTLTLIYDTTLDRWLEKSRCIISIA